MRLHRWLPLAATIFLAAAPAFAQSPIRADLGPPWLVDGKIQWPPNDGCADAEKPATLPAGMKIDRYGSENGSYFATPGTPYAQRALPYDPAKLPYAIYIVKKPLAVLECRIAAWFGEPGGGEQFKASEPAAQLKAEGVIENQ